MNLLPYSVAVKKVGLKVITHFPFAPMFRITLCHYPQNLASDYHMMPNSYHASFFLNGQMTFQQYGKTEVECRAGTIISIPPSTKIQWATAENADVIHIHHKGFNAEEYGAVASIFGPANTQLSHTRISPSLMASLANRIITPSASVGNDMIVSLACLEIIVNATTASLQTDSSDLRQTPLAVCIAYIENHLHENIRVSDLAKSSHICVSKVHEIFQHRMKCTPVQYIARRKAELAKRFLLQGPYNVTEVAELLGFNSLSYFSRFFKKQTGLNPAEIKSTHDFI